MISIALPKGRLGSKAYNILRECGYTAGELDDDSRKLVIENAESGVRYFLVKPSDVAIYVEYGAADVGVVGKDVLIESGADVYELLDLGIGKCRMCVAAREDYVEDTGRATVVATKFPRVARGFFSATNREIEVIKLYGSIELAPLLGMSDVIVDLVETGTTIRENKLKVTEEIFPVSARLIANKAAYKFKEKEIREIVGRMREVTAK